MPLSEMASHPSTAMQQDTEVPARGAAGRPALRILVVAVVLSFMALWLLHDPHVADPDLGFHLRTGDWILQHHAVPRVETFSSYGQGRPWVAYSWLYELTLSLLFRWQELVGIVIFGIAMRLAVGVALWNLISKRVPDLATAAALSLATLFVACETNGPRPVFFSMLFVVLVLDAMIDETDSWKRRFLLLPALFALWANLHIQFVHGLAILGAFAAEASWRRWRGSGTSPTKNWALLGVCTAATLVNPYGVGVWRLVWTFLHQPKLYDLIIEMQAPTFREAIDYIALFMVIAAGFAMGWSRRARPAWILLLLFAAEQGFRSQRELWFVAVIAAAILADCIGRTSNAIPTSRLTLREAVAAGLCTLALIGAGARFFNLNNDFLRMAMHGRFPEVAVRAIERNHLQGRIFNDYGWGGYLMWRLPSMQVSIDGRANNVHDQEHVERSWDTWRGKAGWQSDPDLTSADVIVGRADYPLTTLLRSDPRFRVLHEDREAVVFVPAKK